MNLSQGIALSGILLAGLFLISLRFLNKKAGPTLSKFLRISGLIYLSSTVVMYLLIRYRPILSTGYVILAESLALSMHILSSAMMFFFSKKLTGKAEQARKDPSRDDSGPSDVESE
ncbi:MAG: hypothetical protein JW817_04770 [Clostridiales bacterium]|nr:hypothetical protein [Clostridiales bacterium]